MDQNKNNRLKIVTYFCLTSERDLNWMQRSVLILTECIEIGNLKRPFVENDRTEHDLQRKTEEPNQIARKWVIPIIID